MDEICIKSEDNVKIVLSHINNHSDSVLIIAHGWFMNKDSKYFSDMSKDFSNYLDVISFDFRGHGKSGGFYTFTAKEVMDLKAVVDYAKKQYERIYLIGFSLGAANVLIHGAFNNDVRKIIAVSAPVSFMKIENRVWHPNAWIPTLNKFELKRWLTVRPSLMPFKKIKPVDVVDKINAPTLFIAGEKDPIVLPWHTKTLYDKAMCEKKFELFKNCLHAEDIYISKKKEFIKICIDWILS